MSVLRTCRVVTLGCKVNQYETQYVKEVLEWNGYREARDGEPADLCVVNTCTVTNEADAKGRQLIRRLAAGNPGAGIIVMGCYATRSPESVFRLPGVVKVVTDKARLGEELRQFGVELLPSGITRFDGHQRAFVKVQDGCLLNCSFCIIPSVRPALRSRPIEDIAAEVEGLVREGCQEIVLTGIHLGHYGIDLSRGRPPKRWSRLWHLIRRLDEVPGDFRVRLSSLEAAEVRGELVTALQSSPRICPHLHLCLQSGSDRILALMKRRYSSDGFLDRCRRLSDVLDKPAFSTDVIVGFPGESEADFEATCRVVRVAGFSSVHIFPFSPRSGTPAAQLPDQVPAPVISERRQRLEGLGRSVAAEYARSLVGRRLDVLVEGPARHLPGHVTGTSCRNVPVAFPGHVEALLGRIVPVQTHSHSNGWLLGDPVPSQPPSHQPADKGVLGRVPLTVC